MKRYAELDKLSHVRFHHGTTGAITTMVFVTGYQRDDKGEHWIYTEEGSGRRHDAPICAFTVQTPAGFDRALRLDDLCIDGPG